MAKLDSSPLPDNNDNGAKYRKSVKDRGYENLKQTPAEASAKTDDTLLKVLVKEGLEIINAEQGKSPSTTPTPKDDSKNLEKAMGEMSKNPYVRARIKILNDMTEDRRKRIEEAEKTGNMDTYTYKDFVKEVIKLGDQFSNKSN